MIFVKSPYFNINRICLILLGIWPYEKHKFIYMQRFFCLAIFISFTLCQLLPFIEEKYTVHLFVNTLSQTLPIVICLLKYNTFLINSDAVKLLLEQMQHNWTILNGKELEIVKQYANNSRLFMTMFSLSATIGICSLAFIHFIPGILDVVLPLNVSRPRRTYVKLEFLVNEEKYFYAILFYTLLSLSVIVATVVSTGASLLTFGQHSCAMFKIACYRMEHAMDKYVALHIAKRKKIQNEIVSAVNIHRKALDYADTLTSSFMMSYFGLIVIGVISLSFNLFRLSQGLFYTRDMEDMLVSLGFICGHLIYMFWANYGSQVITDHFEDIFVAAYGIPWYVAPIRIQKLIMFLLQRGTKAFILQIGGLFIGSFEGFATLISTSLSYFTIIYATR